MTILARVVRDGVILYYWTFFTLETVNGRIYATGSFGRPNNELQTFREFEIERDDGRKCEVVIIQTITDLITDEKRIVFLINDERFIQPN